MGRRDGADLHVIEEMARRLPRWHLQAACRDEDPGLFFLQKGHDYAEARKICAACPVFDDCLEEARTSMTGSSPA